MENDESLNAIIHPAKFLQIIACAGSGKTHCMTHRIRHGIEHGDKPGRVAAFTFTRKASKEMRDRLAPMIGKTASKNLWLGTFHSIGLRLLKRYGDLGGFNKNFKVCNEDESKQILKRLLKERELPTDVTEDLYAEICRTKRALCVPATETYGYTYNAKEFIEVINEYTNELKANNRMDYEDLICNTIYLLRKAPQVRSILAFSHISIDEFQDTDLAQFEFVLLLCGIHTRITIVGDPDQAIYSFRGADPRVILKVPKFLPEVEIITLDYNRRCSGNITHGAAAMIGKNQSRIEHKITTTNPPGSPITIISAYSRKQEAEEIVREINRLHTYDLPYSSMSVLYRNNYQGEEIEDHLVLEQIPYRISGSRWSFTERNKVKAAMAHLRLVQDGSNDSAAKACLRYGMWDLTEDGKKKITASKRANLREAIDKGSVKINPVDRVKALHMFDVIDGLRDVRDSMSNPEFFRHMLIMTRLWFPLQGVLSDSLPTGDYGVLYDLAGKMSSVDALLEYLSAIPAEEDIDHIHLQTVHCAKGQEFPIVFLIGAEEGVIPDYRAKEKSEIEEERRIFYVGMTRAKQKLYVSHAKYREGNFGERREVSSSPFLRDIPPEYTIRRVLDDVYDKGRERKLLRV